MSPWPLRMAKAQVKAPFPPQSLKKCPCGHVHISWSHGDEYLICWDCNRRYALDASFQPRKSGIIKSVKRDD